MDTVLENISDTDRLRLAHFNAPRRRIQFLVGRAVLWNMTGQMPVVDENGRPCVSGAHVSVAHSENWVIVAMASKNVGVDIENCRKNRDFITISADFFGEESNSLFDFYKKFVAYESRFKVNDFNADVRYFQMGDYLMSVAGGDEDIEWCGYDGEIVPLIMPVSAKQEK